MIHRFKIYIIFNNLTNYLKLLFVNLIYYNVIITLSFVLNNPIYKSLLNGNVYRPLVQLVRKHASKKNTDKLKVSNVNVHPVTDQMAHLAYTI